MQIEEETFEALQLRLEIDKNGTKRYYNHKDLLHRKFGPAVMHANGDKAWFVNGGKHRVDGPAVENSNGSKFWWINGERHRVDGPAVVYADGSEICYLNSQILSREDFLKHPLCTIK